ncbi:MAG: PSD1 domain-containing protein [Planctomycetaceae bacterium]|nr:PSD1 domain-containing protein [Planctomycetaceae bacterium]
MTYRPWQSISPKFLRTGLWIAILFAVSLTSTLDAQDTTVDFRRQILPILSDHCFNCHGMDEGTRAGGLRLDQREAALVGGDSGVPAVSPGAVAHSEILTRIASDDPGLMMPPPDAQRPLNDQQRELLRQWIAEGAVYTEHWAFTPPVQPPLPDLTWPHATGPHATGADATTRESEQVDPTHSKIESANNKIPREGHPIDRLVLKQLLKQGWEPNPPAPASQLVRRLYLDLIGLPPSPAEVQRYLEVGHEQTVEELLARPQYGEKWARLWLDAARYSDTNGYEKDMRREQWIWRDWVIRSFNQDQPYDEFIVEQIAGDLLPNASQDQIVATGFLRNSMLNEEGAIVPEEFRMVEMFDRVDCLGKAVLGLTTQCAQCHSHKFDPLTHNEYYGLFAYLNNSYEAQSWIYSEDQLQQRQEVLRVIGEEEGRLRSSRPSWLTDLQSWAGDVRAKLGQWQPVRMDDMGSLSGLNHPVQLPDHSILMLGHTSGDVYFLATPDLQGITGLQLEVLTHGDLPFRGPGRSELGTWGILELEFWTKQGEQEWQKESLVHASADWSEPEQSHQEGKQKSGPVAFLIDGNDAQWWQADRGIGRRNQGSVAVVQFAQPLSYPAGTQTKIVLRMNNMVGCCRVSLTSDANPATPAVALHAQQVVRQWEPAAAPWETLSPAQQDTLFTAWRQSQMELAEFNRRIDEHWARFPVAQTSVFHLLERPTETARRTYHLERGQWNSPTTPIAPHTPAFLPPLSPVATEPPRLQFARWLVDRQSPLAARVAVNRIWQALYGQGIVTTPEDFGTRAAVPEHLELLDWLAVEFMNRGWSRKEILRLIVTSQTYRQDSRCTTEVVQRDPTNRWLARGPRFRADAEVVRDIALATSGLLSLKMGGPGVIPPVPQNVLDYNYVYPGYWTAATGEDRYRRTIYGFRKRSMPDPVTSNFDAPNGDTACVQRVRSNTPLAALTGLNETIFTEAARGLGLRILREGGATDELRATYGFALCTSRSPSPDEMSALMSLVQQQRQRLAEGWLDPKPISTGENRLPDLPAGCTPQDVAAWSLIARVLLNLDETISKN